MLAGPSTRRRNQRDALHGSLRAWKACLEMLGIRMLSIRRPCPLSTRSPTGHRAFHLGSLPRGGWWF